MKKAFISILGTTEYKECRHSFGNIITEEPVKYCQEDIIKIFCKDFDEESEIRIFLTEEAEKKNWLDDGHIDRKNNNPIQNEGLKRRLEYLQFRATIKPIRIKEGYTEDEIWNIFQIIFESFRDEEEVIVDITHSFRSLPMLMITLLNYAKQVKKIKVSGIYYAAFESLGPIPVVSKIPVENRIVPILNLTPFTDLQDWTNATYDFIKNANVSKMKELVRTSVTNQDISNSIEKFFPVKVVEKLEQLVNDIALCRGKDLLQFNFNDLRNNLESLKEKELPNPFIYLIDEILYKINSFNNDYPKLTITLAEWCLSHKLFQQAITLLQEFTITIICINNNLNYKNEDDRTLVAQSFRIFSQKIPEDKWKKPSSENIELVNHLLQNEILKKLSSYFSSLTELRNDVNHSGFLDNAKPVSSIQDRLKNIIESYKKILL